MNKQRSRAAQNVMIAGGNFNREKDYWLNRLSGKLTVGTFFNNNPPLRDDLPTALTGLDRSFRFPDGLFREIVRIGNHSEYGVFIILTAAVSYLVSRYSGKEDIIIGVPVLIEDKEDSYFNQMLPLRNPVPADETFKDLLVRVKNTVSETYENMNYPLDDIAKQLDLAYQIDRFYDIVVVFENIHGNAEEVAKEHPQNMVCVFNMTGEYLEGRLRGHHFSDNKRLLVQQFQKHLINLFQVIAPDLLTALSDIEILGEDDKNKLLYEFNKTRVGEFAGCGTVHQTFEEQVYKSPDRTALEYDGHSWTYNALNRQINRLSGYLYKRGLRSDSICGIMMERSVEQIVGIFAALKLGAAFVALDPRLPLERIEFMVKDTALQALLISGDARGNSKDFHEAVPVNVPVIEAVTLGPVSESDFDIPTGIQTGDYREDQ
ncbi:MAG: AMP-binding protein, partial [bacterium]|nr:AMP-binding protein [bacterium]